MAADLNKPITTDNYVNILSDIRDNLAALAKMDMTGVGNVPTGAKQYSEGNNRFEKWNGTAWVALLQLASTSIAGLVQLSNSTSSTSQTLAATPLAVKTVADAKVNKSGDTMTGNLAMGQNSFTGVASVALLNSSGAGSVSALSGGGVTLTSNTHNLTVRTNAESGKVLVEAGSSGTIDLKIGSTIVARLTATDAIFAGNARFNNGVIS